MNKVYFLCLLIVAVSVTKKPAFADPGTLQLGVNDFPPLPPGWKWAYGSEEISEDPAEYSEEISEENNEEYSERQEDVEESEEWVGLIPNPPWY